MKSAPKLSESHQELENLAVNIFEKQYKKEITDIVISRFGKSFQQAAACENSWYSELIWTKERENFILLKTKIFIAFLPDNDKRYNDPRFLKSLVGKIAEYLSFYGVKADTSWNRDCHADRLFIILFSENENVKRRIERYEIGHAKRRKAKQKRKLKKARGQILRTGTTNIQIDVFHSEQAIQDKRREILVWSSRENSNKR